MKVNPKVNVKLRTKKLLELSIVLAFGILIVLFIAFRGYERKKAELQEATNILKVVDIPATEQVKLPPPPSAPSVPVESDDETLIDDVTIENTANVTSFVAYELPPPPATVKKIEQAQEIIPAFLLEEYWPKFNRDELVKNIKYPEIARLAQITGDVVVRVLINKDGKPVEPFEILQSLGKSGCDEAVIEGIKKTPFEPAENRGVKVPYRLVIKVTFILGTIK